MLALVLEHLCELVLVVFLILLINSLYYSTPRSFAKQRENINVRERQIMAKFVPKFKAKTNDEDKYINILLLGESGAGKSTFINSFVNYLQFSSLSEAENGAKMQCLIPTKFSIVTDDGETKVINFGADSNEDEKLGNSSTQAAKAYVFPFEKKTIRLIDTPGINDSRGAITKDHENFENILEYIGQFKHLHAVCFLLKPDVTVLTAGFKYCLVELFSRLDRSAATNIAFLFSRTRSTDYKAPDTINCVRRVLGEIEESVGVVIPLRYRNAEHKNCFYFDNEGFKYLVARGEGVKTGNAACLERSWDVSFQSSWDLIHYIVGDEKNAPLPPHIVQDTVSVNEARRLIFELAKPLADITELVQDNLDTLRRHQADLVNENLTGEDLKAKLYVPVVDLVEMELPQPVTVCAAAKCAKIYTVSGLKKYHYEQRCHNPCYLHDVQKDLVGDPGLIRCAAMGGTQKCKLCMCDFSVHMHVYYETKVVESKIEDQTIQTQLVSNAQIIKAKYDYIRKAELRVQEYQEEHKAISIGLATFAYFLKNNSICPINDAYEAYLDCLIQREKIAFGSNKDLLQRYESLKKEHIEQKRILEEAGRLSKTHRIAHVTSEQIINTVERLKKLRLTGSKIAALHDLLVGSKRKEILKNMEYVHSVTARMPMKPTANPVGDTVGVGAKRKGKNSQADMQKKFQDLFSSGDFEGASQLLQTLKLEQEKEKEADAANKQQLADFMKVIQEYTNNQTEQRQANANTNRGQTTRSQWQRGQSGRGRGNQWQNRGQQQPWNGPSANRENYNQNHANFHQNRGNSHQNRGNFNQNRGNFNQNRGNFNQNPGNFNQNPGNFNQERVFHNTSFQHHHQPHTPPQFVQQPPTSFMMYGVQGVQPQPQQQQHAYHQQRPVEPIQFNINLGATAAGPKYKQPMESMFNNYTDPPPAYSAAMHRNAPARGNQRQVRSGGGAGGAGGQFKKPPMRKQPQTHAVPASINDEDEDEENEAEDGAGIVEMKKYLAEKRRNFQKEHEAEEAAKKQANNEQTDNSADNNNSEGVNIEKVMSTFMKLFKKP